MTSRSPSSTAPGGAQQSWTSRFASRQTEPFGELRAPLTAVTFALASVRRLDDVPQSAQMAIDMIRRNLDLEARLIDDLLDVTRIQRGKLRLEPEVLDPYGILEDVARLCTPTPEHEDVALWLEPPHGAPAVRADPLRLRQAVWNLVTNALRHTPKGGRVTLDVHAAGDDARIVVRDTGPGIPEATLPRIFAPFEQSGHAAGPGLGLGLAIVKGIVDSHGGRIVAENAASGGACFSMTLPGVAAAVPTQPAAPPPRAAERQASCRILFVEDNEDNAHAISEFLRAAGYEVLVATSVHAALERADDPFDVVVSDLGLPDGTGCDVVRRLLPHHPVPAIALSGYGTDQDVARAIASGFTLHLTKPVDPEQLLAAIERVRPPATN